MSQTHVGTIDDFPEGEVHPRQVGGTDIVLVRVGNEIFACGGVCSHAEAYLDMGRTEGYEVLCPLHSGRFDLRTGAATHRPAREPIPSYPVRLVGRDVYVEVSGDTNLHR